MRRQLMMMTMAALLGAGLAVTALAQEVCFECHDRANFSGGYIHGPVARGECGSCHNPHVAKFSGLLQQREAELCYGCHRRSRVEFGQGEVHQPVQEGKCLECHAPHRAEQPGLLRQETAVGCMECHQQLERQWPVNHTPFGQGQCTTCHQPHQSKHGNLLKNRADDLCLSCHRDPQNRPGHRGFPGELTNCLSCHHPHGGEGKGLLRRHLHQPFAQRDCASCHQQQAVGSETCLSCHPSIRESMLRPYNHMIAGAHNGCTQCHSPHAGDDRKMLRMTGNKVCQSCHTDTFARGRVSLHRHPLHASCTECHEVHGSERVAMLRADGNQVCSRCHLTQGEFSHPVGEAVVDHRTGQNMTCVTCHDPMGTDYRFHLVLSGRKELCVQCHRDY